MAKQGRKQALWVSVVILLSVFALWSTRLANPMTGRHDNVTAQVALASDNFRHYGFLSVGFLHTFDADPTRIIPERYYVSTPALPAILTTLWQPHVRDTPFAARLITLWLTLLGACALYRFADDLYGSRIAQVSLGIFCFVPIIAFYGIAPIGDVYFLATWSLVLLVYYRWLQRPRHHLLGILAGLILLSALSNRTIVIAAAALSLHVLIFARARLPALVAINGAIGLGLLGWFAPAMVVMPDFFERLLDRFSQRSFAATQPPWEHGFDYLWTMLWARIRPRYTEAVLALSGLGVMRLLFNLRSGQKRAGDSLVLISLLPGILSIFIFAEAYYTHDFLTVNLAFGLALCAALGFDWVFRMAFRYESFKRLVLIALIIIIVIGFVASSLRWTVNLYTEIDPFAVEVGAAIQERVPAGVPVYSNYPFSPALRYYAQRDIYPLNDTPTDESTYWVMDCHHHDDSQTTVHTVQSGKYTCLFTTQAITPDQ